MNIVIDVVAVLFIMLMTLIGSGKGFFYGIVGFIGMALAAGIAYFATPIVVDFLQNTFGLTTALGNLLREYFDSLPGMTAVIGDRTLPEALNEGLGIPEFIGKIIFEQIVVINYDPTMTVSQILSGAFSIILTNIICGAVILILSCVFISLGAKIFSAFFYQISFLHYLNRFLGLILGFAKGLLIVAIVAAVLSLLPVKEVADVVAQTTFLNYLNSYILPLIPSL